MKSRFGICTAIYAASFPWLLSYICTITSFDYNYHNPSRCCFLVQITRGVLPYMGYIGMCGPKGYGFSAVLVINRVSIIAILPPLWS